MLQDLHNKKLFKNFEAETKVADGAPRTLVVRITSPAPDRSKDTVQPTGMNANNYEKNPVVLYAHNYADIPIAKCNNLKVTDEGILASVEFPQEGVYAKADTVYAMYKGGFLNAWSIGFMPTDYDENDQGGYNFKEWELFEFSAVPVPDNPEALTVMRSKGIDVDTLFEKGVLPYKETPKAPDDASWDAGEEVKAASVDDLKVMCAWVDSENADNKGAYKLPHHLHSGEHDVVWRGVAAAMGALLGARGGVQIPDGDRKGVYNHLAKHYKQFDKEVPPFKAVGEYNQEALLDLDKKGLIDFGDEVTLTKELFREMEKQILEKEEKSGRSISSKHESLLKGAVENIQSVLSSVSTSDDDDGKEVEMPLTKRLLNQINTAQKQMKETDKQVGLTLRLIKVIQSESKQKGGEIK